MNRHSLTAIRSLSGLLLVTTVIAVTAAVVRAGAADDARSIMTEVQKRSRVESQRYQGLLRVTLPDGREHAASLVWSTSPVPGDDEHLRRSD